MDKLPKRHAPALEGERRTAQRHGLRGAAAVGALMLLSPVLYARKHPLPTKTIKGAVLDASDNPVAGAEVELTDLTTGKKLAIYSLSEGRYSFGGLSLDHDYQVQAKFNGVASEARKVSSLDPRTRMVINLYLPPPKK